jgi:starvation-inducible outer membrane lipoprotein
MREMKFPLFTRVLILFVLASLLLSACASQPVEAQTERAAAIQSDGTLRLRLKRHY